MAQHADWVQHRIRELLTATFMAALLMVLHHSVPVIDVLDRFAFLFASSSSMQVVPAEPDAIVIGIDQKTLEQDFYEQSPLNRCAMAEKLRIIYAAHPTQLVIDFDLSPSLAGVLAGPADASREVTCEAQLYTVLQTHAATSRTILLAPTAVGNDTAQAAKQSWRSMLSSHGVLFGDGTLPVQFGFVQQQYAHGGTLAALAHAGVSSSAADGQPAGAGAHQAPHGAHGAESNTAAPDESAHAALKPLNFRAYGRDVRSVTWSDWRGATPALALQGKTVFFGAAYGSDDRFLTPVDDLYGVDLHAAAFVSLRHPISIASAGSAMLIDIVIGMMFGLMVAWAWSRYLKAKQQQVHAHPGQHAFAFLYLWLLVAAYLSLLLLLMHGTAMLIAAFNVWISPLPMALGMTVDAFIIGAIHAIEHARAPHGSKAHHVVHSAKSGPWPAAAARMLRLAAGMTMSPAPVPVRAAELLKLSTWCVVVAYALVLIVHH